MKTFMANAANVKREWHLVDATDRTLGRLAATVAGILMGKHRPTYTPHCDAGDFVVITNASKIYVSGKKASQKVYRYHTQFVGNLKEISYRRMSESDPERIIWYAVRRMLPKTKLGDAMMAKLKIFAGADHKHQAQNPKPLAI